MIAGRLYVILVYIFRIFILVHIAHCHFFFSFFSALCDKVKKTTCFNISDHESIFYFEKERMFLYMSV